jgi:threonine dehydrogenase-like Zn-dependent dehydrogenase
LAEISDLPTADSNPIVIVGGGPMGCLIARALTRLHPSIRVTIVEPLDDRRQVIEDLKIADVVIPRISTGQKNPISFVACSELKASVDAVSTAAPGGSVILFSGINNGELTSDQSRYWEYIHRRELRVREDNPITGTIFLIGSSGYTIAEIEKAVQELYLHYPHYSLIQNRIVHGLNSEVELLLSPRGIHDQKHGSEIARVLKPLIML